MFNKQNKKIKKTEGRLRIGKETQGEFEYAAKIDLSQDLFAQIDDLMKEKEINDALRGKIDNLREIAKKYKKKEKTLSYYYETGKSLQFLKDFEEFSHHSVLRKIAEDVPELLPFIGDKWVRQKHLDMMYKLAYIKKFYLKMASWKQWYDILMFKDVHKDQSLLDKILKRCKNGLSGDALRKYVKEIRG